MPEPTEEELIKRILLQNETKFLLEVSNLLHSLEEAGADLPTDIDEIWIEITAIIESRLEKGDS